MDIISAIEKRRSIRKFLTRSVDLNVVKEIIRLGTLAPTSCDRQAWRFIIVTDKKIMIDMKNNRGALFIPNAPIGILVLYHKFTNNLEYADNIESASACIENMLLAATNFGLGACWVNDLPQISYLYNFFEIPKRYHIVAYLVLGYPAHHPKEILRKYSTIDELISYNKFETKKEIQKKRPRSWLSLRFIRMLKRIYYISLWFFNKLFPKIIDRLKHKFGVEKHDN